MIKLEETLENAKEQSSWLWSSTLKFLESGPGKCMQQQLSALGVADGIAQAAVQGKMKMLLFVPKLLTCLTKWDAPKTAEESMGSNDEL